MMKRTSVKTLLLSYLLLLTAAAAAQSLPFSRIPSAPIRFTRLRGNPNVLEGRRIHVTFVTDTAVTAHYGRWDTLVAPGYERLFTQRFNKLATDHHIIMQTDTAGATYQLTVTTQRLDRGFDEGIVSRAALIDVLMDFRNEQGRTVALLQLEHIPGQVFGFDNEFTPMRIAQCYDKLAVVLYNRILDFFPEKGAAEEDR